MTNEAVVIGIVTRVIVAGLSASRQAAAHRDAVVGARRRARCHDREGLGGRTPQLCREDRGGVAEWHVVRLLT